MPVGVYTWYKQSCNVPFLCDWIILLQLVKVPSTLVMDLAKVSYLTLRVMYLKSMAPFSMGREGIDGDGDISKVYYILVWMCKTKITLVHGLDTIENGLVLLPCWIQKWELHVSTGSYKSLGFTFIFTLVRAD